jgi:Uma2 family endonuclease
MSAVTINFAPAIAMTDEQFYELCQANRDLKFERSANGDLILMPPTGGTTGNRNAGLNAQLWLWNERTKLGIVFDSSTCFKLPNGADRSPDAAWIKLERWYALTPEQQEKFPPICPDFVVELLSPSDSLPLTQAKMREYQENGASLGLLINRKTKQVEIYQSGRDVEIRDRPQTLSAENLLPGFTLNLDLIW